MIHYKSTEEIELMRESCALVSSTLALVATFLKAGMSTLEVDGLAEEFIRDNKATPHLRILTVIPMPPVFL
jgi:methionyl aminopeptidase